jgi:hypothetical protein
MTGAGRLRRCIGRALLWFVAPALDERQRIRRRLYCSERERIAGGAP